MHYQDVLDFWFHELESKQWWVKNPELDQQILKRFKKHWDAAVVGELFVWRDNPKGRLAEILVLDQFSRNMFRDTPQSFAQDPLALILSQEAIKCGADESFNSSEKAFLYMPYMHSESRLIHAEALKLYDQPGLEFNLEFEIKHKVIIDRFGRYPHRNSILGRASSEEEIAFLKEPNSSF